MEGMHTRTQSNEIHHKQRKFSGSQEDRWKREHKRVTFTCKKVHLSKSWCFLCYTGDVHLQLLNPFLGCKPQIKRCTTTCSYEGNRAHNKTANWLDPAYTKTRHSWRCIQYVFIPSLHESLSKKSEEQGEKIDPTFFVQYQPKLIVQVAPLPIANISPTLKRADRLCKQNRGTWDKRNTCYMLWH